MFSQLPFSFPEWGLAKLWSRPQWEAKSSNILLTRISAPKRRPTSVGVVEGRAHGNAADELEHVAQALAHALRGFAPEDLREADVRMGEADGEALSPRGDATHLEVRLAEVHLALTGQPPERQVP
jgi:hypothetical protein